ncbi:D-alanyl-D-alanine carboxypeptidase/D-alanyl-D-alanine endopeptidase [Yinghuangia soli]|uniref:D-alanyl-D-alanine carboxypeptidase/D-alanyl-D-alanine-endopeptidase n=1 Tax=Yinghuangia soli TaxID=2908204 RepID=A0AA41U336_9ACTN|nr:D-alanyl-D-alanine carboxypeptidase/D-alanyl-D-alanine-endopeptidase [Yinghuangia soli]MCF2529307.1 D-alanyl-D-alanine carboxypeptidase/D-alanyl-D-alanine-endopeptidase [Yinghuangia soli]
MPRVRTVALAATVAGILLAVLAVWAAGPWQDGYRVGEHHGSKRSGGAQAGAQGASGAAGGGTGERRITPPVLAPVDENPAGRLPTDQGVKAVLEPLLADKTLGGPGKTAVSVVDVATGRTLYAVDADRGAVPASTTKVATGVAALAALKADQRFTTRVLAGAAPGTIVLVGGGDPTLTALDGSQYAGQYAPARLDALAAATAKALRAAGITQVQLAYDTSLYSGPANHPISPNDNIAPVVALMADEGRVDGKKVEGPSARVADPAAKAAEQFAQLVARQGIAVNGKPAAGSAAAGTAGTSVDPAPAAQAGTAPAPGTELAAVHSPPVPEVVEQMMMASDNDIAEALLRHIAVAKGKPASFAGGSEAVKEVLAGLGVNLGAMHLEDGSGLNRANKLPPAVLTGLITLAASPAHPELRTAVTGMPIAGFTGTLKDRFGRADVADATGIVRAKTGSLTGVSTLAGVVRDADGRLLAFAFLADQVPGGADLARPALDKMAAALGDCGCGTPAASAPAAAAG